MTDGDAVEIRLSGTIEVARDGESVTLPGRRVRALLVMLALSAGRTVQVDTLARGIWGDEPPERVRGSLQTYIGRLRRVLGTDLVITDNAGYRFALPPDAVDLLRFERLAAASADATDPVTAGARLDEALALWRGEPFGDPPSEWIEQQLVPELTERHLQAVERRIDLDLSDGDASAHLPTLRNLIERHPLRETLWMRLVTALDCAGRTAEALERYEALRNRLVDELGVDPSPELQRIHQQLLTKETPSPSAGTYDRATVPGQLPRAITGFTGRAKQLTELDSTISADDAALIALHGPGGVGKTSLAIYWASRNREVFPDGQLFVDLRGYGPGEPVGPLEALDSLLRGLGTSGAQIPGDVDGRSSLLRTMLSNRRALVVLDNAREAAQVRPLLAGGATTTMVTSRSQLRGLVSREGARRIAVEPMSTTDAVALLAARFGIAADDKVTELAELADLCAHLPVALTVAAERADRDGHLRIADVNERLRDEHERLATLTDWSDDPLTDVRAVFSWSYRHLDTDSARIFRLLGLHPDPHITVHAAAALTGVEARTAERLLDRLTESNLLTEVSPGWHEMHDLAHAYAAELATADPDETKAAVRRMRSWYLHSVHAARAIHGPTRIAVPIPAPLAGTSPMTFDTADIATDWLTAHHRTIRVLLMDAAADGDDDFAARLTPLLFRFFKYNGANQEAIEVFTVAEQCARRTNDPLLEATCSYFIGHLFDYVGDTKTSLARMEAAGDLFAAVDDTAGQTGVEIALGTAYAKFGRLEQAISSLDSARRRASASDPALLPIVENNLATTYLEVGRVREAVETAGEAVRTATGTDLVDRENLATSHVTLGEALTADRQWEAAVRSFDESVRLFAESGNVVRQILSRQLRGVAHREVGDADAARLDWTTALELLDHLGTDEIPSHRTVDTGRRGQLCRLLDGLDDGLSGDAGT